MTFYDVKDIQIQPFSTSSSRTTFLLYYKEVFLEVGADVVDFGLTHLCNIALLGRNGRAVMA